MNWSEHFAAIYRARKNELKPVKDIDEIRLCELVGLENQKKALLQNTINFIENKGANHALLWGAKGCGKSSLIKAVFNELKNRGLRIVELYKQDLNALAEIIDELREENKFKFIIYCDDFSFENNDESYKFLKPLLDGSIERAPDNILLYASSNRRHLISENVQDNFGANILRGELHLGDSSEEKLSLADRFGLWLSFYQGNLEDYLKIVEFYFQNHAADRQILRAKAMEFAGLRASRSARTARQFYNSFKDILK